MAFEIHTDRDVLVSKIAALEPFKLAAHANEESREGRAEYIRKLTKLVADHIEVCVADAETSTCGTAIGEEDAQGIADIGSDLAGRIEKRS